MESPAKTVTNPRSLNTEERGSDAIHTNRQEIEARKEFRSVAGDSVSSTSPLSPPVNTHRKERDTMSTNSDANPAVPPKAPAAASEEASQEPSWVGERQRPPLEPKPHP